MAFVQHEESRRLRRFMFWSAFILIVGAHLVRVASFASTGGGGGPGLTDVFTRVFWGNFQTHIIRPLNDFRLGFGDLLSGAAKICPDSAVESCDKGFGVLRLILGLHP